MTIKQALSGSCGGQFPEADGGHCPEGGGIQMLVAAMLLFLNLNVRYAMLPQQLQCCGNAGEINPPIMIIVPPASPHADQGGIRHCWRGKSGKKIEKTINLRGGGIGGIVMHLAF